MEFFGNAAVFGLLVMAQFGLFDGLFGGKSDGSSTTDEPGPGTAPGYDAAKYQSVIEGNDTAEQITVPAEKGATAVFAKGGDDVVRVGATNDYVHGGSGNDTIFGGDGDDIIYGGDGNDKLYGELGNDVIHGGAGDDHLHGSRDNDTLYGDAGNDTIEGGGRDDTLYGGDGDDVISADLVNDWSKISRGTDALYGGAGNDRLILTNDDTATGGEGKDTFQVVEITSTKQAAKIQDFNAAEDKLEIMAQPRTDASGATVPAKVAWSYDDTNGVTTVTLDGTAIATLKGNVAFTSENLVVTTTTKPVG